MRYMILASACAAALLVSGAASAQVTGTLEGGYSRVLDNGGADIYGLTGTLDATIGSGWNFEGTGSYANLNPGSADLWSMGGNLYTNTGFGRVAFGALHGGTDGGHATSYGAGADWFFSDDITLSLKGGGEYSTGGANGAYVGGQGIYYLTPNFALSASADFVGDSVANIDSEKVKAEWLFSDTLPLSVYGGYQRYDAEHGSGSDVLFVGLKFYLDGASTLVGHQRTGSLGYIGQSFFQVGTY